MEREVLFTGVGGQGVQIASKTLATAAIAEGRQVMLVPRYGGGMRGGMTNAEVTIGDGALRALPVATSAWSAYVMDPTFLPTIAPNLADGAVVVVNSSLFTGTVDVPGAQVFEVPASDVAAELGNPMTAGFVLLGAYRGPDRPGQPRQRHRRHARVGAGVSHPASRSQRPGPAGRRRPGTRPGRTGLGQACGGGLVSASPRHPSSQSACDPGHRGARRRALQGLRLVRPGLPAGRAVARRAP